PAARAASVATTRSGAETPPPAPWPSTSARRAGTAGCRWTRAGPAGVSTWDVRERVRVGAVAAGLAAVEPVDRRDVGGLELEVEDLDVLADPLGRHRLREDDVPVLDVPAEDDLRDRFADALGDLGQRRVTEHFALCDRRPRLADDPVRPAVLVDFPVLEVRVELDLVHRGHHVRFGGEALEMRNLEVRDADRSRPAVALELLERLPRRHEVAAVERRQGPVNEEQ